MFTFIAFDTETTGTSIYNDSIIEIGAVRFKNGKAVEEFSTFVNSGQIIPEAATRVHGITNDMLDGAPDTESAIELFTDFCQGDCLVAHNAAFDVKFLSSAYNQYQVATPNGRIFDTYIMAKKIRSELLNHRLENLVKHYGIPASTFHRACADSQMCGQVFLMLLIDLSKQRNERLKMQYILQLHDLNLEFPQIAPQAKQLGLL